MGMSDIDSGIWYTINLHGMVAFNSVQVSGTSII